MKYYLEPQDITERTAQWATDEALVDLRNKWHLYRGLIPTPCNVAFLPRKNAFVILSSFSICPKEHKIVLSSYDWGCPAYFPIDKIEAALYSFIINGYK